MGGKKENESQIESFRPDDPLEPPRGTDKPVDIGGGSDIEKPKGGKPKKSGKP